MDIKDVKEGWRSPNNIVLLSYDERFIPACMLAKSINIFEKLAAEKEKTQNAQKGD